VISFNPQRRGGTLPHSRGTKCPSDASCGPSKRRGRRECRALNAPAASRVVQKTRELVTTGTPERSGIPCAMVLTGYVVLAPVRPAFVSPSLADHLPQP